MIRESNEIADKIKDYLKEKNYIKYISFFDLHFIGDYSKKESYKEGRVIELLVFQRVIKFDNQKIMWRNNYYKEQK